jgi:hypothetical protein
MGKRILILVILPVLVIALAGVAQAWQGRMGGMGDPFGLVADESDYLIHPAKIANGEGVRFYGGYRFLYTGMTDSHIDLTLGPITTSYDTYGHEVNHDALAGAAFPLGPGRMGLFFTYGGRRGDLHEDDPILGRVIDDTSTFDNFALRLLYGLPIGGGFKLGGELGFAYCQDQQTVYLPTFGALNILVAPVVLTAPPLSAYDSASWEIPFKAGVEGALGPLDVEFTVHGGVIASGANKPSGNIGGGEFEMQGDVSGWRLGGDLWARYPLGEGLTLPFVVSMNYEKKTRDADFSSPPALAVNETGESSLNLVVGGGLNAQLAKGTRIAGGVYYNYLHDRASWSFDIFGGAPININNSDYPDLTEHRLVVRLAGEHDFSPTVALRMGLNFFYGWPMEDVAVSSNVMTSLVHSLDGSHWGIGASLGGTIKVKPITLEPFVGGGYQSLNLSGNGIAPSLLPPSYHREDSLSNWYVDGGLSILYDL